MKGVKGCRSIITMLWHPAFLAGKRKVRKKPKNFCEMIELVNCKVN
jgi:hypothetical protein